MNMIKVGKYNVSEKIIDEMNKAIKETKDDGHERKFNLCTKPNSNVLITGKKVRGGLYNIENESKCKKGQSKIGDFHTHPPWSTNIMSTKDISLIYKHKDKIGCIGNIDGIKCHIPIKTKDCNLSSINRLDNIQYKRTSIVDTKLEKKYANELYPYRDDFDKMYQILLNKPEKKVDNKIKDKESENYLNKCFKTVKLQ